MKWKKSSSHVLEKKQCVHLERQLQKKVDKLQQDLAKKEVELQEASHVADKKGLAEAEWLREKFALAETANAELQKENGNLQLKLTKVHKETFMEMNQTLKKKTTKIWERTAAIDIEEQGTIKQARSGDWMARGGSTPMQAVPNNAATPPRWWTIWQEDPWPTFSLQRYGLAALSCSGTSPSKD